MKTAREILESKFNEPVSIDRWFINNIEEAMEEYAESKSDANLSFRQRLDKIEQELSARFSDLLTERKLIMFNTKEELEEEIDEYFKCRNDITGQVFDAAILFVSEEGIRVVETEDMEREYYVKFQDLSSILDRINLIEKIELS